jgi:hypothetical protein
VIKATKLAVQRIYFMCRGMSKWTPYTDKGLIKVSARVFVAVYHIVHNGAHLFRTVDENNAIVIRESHQFQGLFHILVRNVAEYGYILPENQVVREAAIAFPEKVC